MLYLKELEKLLLLGCGTVPGSVIHKKFDFLPVASEKTLKIRGNEVMLPCS